MCKIIFILFYVIITIKSSESIDVMRLTFVETFKNVLKSCLKLEKVSNNIVLHCLKIESLNVFDDVMSSNVISLMDGIQLLRVHDNNSGLGFKKIRDRFVNDSYFSTWTNHVLNKIYETFSSSVLQIDIQKIMSSCKNSQEDITMARHRRHRNHMLTVMVFGVTALGMIIVPMGFQFLAVLGGKALLLAKMALILASINGLKKIATSGLNYGFYHVPEPYPYNYYDRGDKGDNGHPRQLSAIKFQ